jgi:adenosylcobyric acid synthase
MASPLMIQGTCSGAGKSLLVAGLCRVFADRGMKVAPFKAQNMALNSFITREGAEIGRAQALQAEAARVEPTADMNPVLLKATGEMGCQVILNGSVHANMTAREYYAFKDQAWPYVTEAYDRLSSEYDLVIIEGAGSPAEINLMKEEIVNMRVARHLQSPVLLIGDIERGGVFASFEGTVSLVGDDAKLIKGFVINKFRGDKDILDPGLDMMFERTGIPTLGVLPYYRDHGLDEEDGLVLDGLVSSLGSGGNLSGRLKVVVVRLGYISNFTDFDPLRHDPSVELTFSQSADEIANADLVIVPGTKNTVHDLLALREAGLDKAILRAAEKGVNVIGVCGGFQMLGCKIFDPDGVESGSKVVKGLGLLDIETEFRGSKVTTQSEGKTSLYGYKGSVRGYEIHMGISRASGHGEAEAFDVTRLAGKEQVADGSIKEHVWGTYLHGVFDDDGFRNLMLKSVRKDAGVLEPARAFSYSHFRERSMDRWARFLEEHLDMKKIEDLI